ncbi:putative ATP phosphoribosyltransferase [Rosa chinensis]|uniref:Putative ATP phosphoribosyltransferase n=1 Tax=Rosa chinensis TaxID=74649 RepID=A0A2P6PMH6_ROSCH|nr:putative ATP phosphoribosyltransferase [Rosa chinensis]PRQ23137.1 putative ATP phosphoribosyltransferase [Rosa chinensis]
MNHKLKYSTSWLFNMQGPTVSPVYRKGDDGKETVDYYAIIICLPEEAPYESVKQLRSIGGSGVIVIPSSTYIFDEETPPRWPELLSNLGL